MQRTCVLYCLLMLFSGLMSITTAAATPTLGDIAQRIEINDQIHGQFVQRKYLSILPNPLLSKGNFSFQPEVGLQWHTVQPLQSRLTFSSKGILQEQNGQQVWLARSDQPGVAVIGQIMAAIFISDWGTLKDFFTIEVSPNTALDPWHVRLTPTQATLASVMTHIELQGDHQLRQMILFEHNGDRTEIDFSPVAATEPPIAPSSTSNSAPATP